MKQKLKIFIIGIILLIPTIVKAEVNPRITYYTYGHKMTWNIENIWYFIDSAASSYESVVADAANNWVHTGYGYNKLYPYTKTTNITLSATDVFKLAEGENALGVTWHFKRVNGKAIGVNGQNGAPTENWLYCHVDLNIPELNKLGNRAKKITTLHEMGHCFGLAHGIEKKSVMYPYYNGLDSSVNGVQEIDHKTFNYIYS